MAKYLTDEQVEREIEHLKQSEAVKLAEYVATALRTYDRKPKRRKENAND